MSVLTHITARVEVVATEDYHHPSYSECGVHVRRDERSSSIDAYLVSRPKGSTYDEAHLEASLDRAFDLKVSFNIFFFFFNFTGAALPGIASFTVSAMSVRRADRLVGLFGSGRPYMRRAGAQIFQKHLAMRLVERSVLCKRWFIRVAVLQTHLLAQSVYCLAAKNGEEVPWNAIFFCIASSQFDNFLDCYYSSAYPIHANWEEKVLRCQIV